jgi:uncharacterized protein
MIPLPDGTLRYSPRDLVAYLDGDFAAWCERMLAERQRDGGAGSDAMEWVSPDEGDEEAALAKRKGDEHEQRWLELFRARHPAIVEIDRADPEGAARTLAAMDAGAPVIYQAHLVAGGWGGYPDFLFRCPGGDCRCRGWHYTPWDTKLARSAKPGHLIQLCAYADMLEALRGFLPSELVFVLGHGETRPYRTGQFLYYYRQLRRTFADFQAGWDRTRPPDPGLDRGWGRWEKKAEALLERSDHLSRVATITRGQVQRLEEAGITTLGALAAFCHPDPERSEGEGDHTEHGPLHFVQGDKRPRLSPKILERLHVQAKLQLESRGHPQPLWQPRPLDPNEPRRGLALLPPPSDGDVFFDMEGFPYAEDGLEYLFGAVTLDDDVVPVYHDWWAHDAREERAGFEQFIDWVVERRRRDPALHVYHYASYEETAVKRLAARYATREVEVDELLRGDVFVDLYNVVRQGFIIGTPSYSLKYIEHLYQPPRTGPVISAGGSIVEYDRWIESGQPRSWKDSPILERIREYNRLDCDSLWALRSWLRERQEESGIDYRALEPPPEPKREPPPERAAAEALAVRLRARAVEDTTNGERARLDELFGCLVEFHRREERPLWWALFERHDRKTVEERFDDPECIAGVVRTKTPPVPEKRSRLLEYSFNPEQETKLYAGDQCQIAGEKGPVYDITRLDAEAGLVEIKVGPTRLVPDQCCLIGYDHVEAEAMKKALLRYGLAWERGEIASQAVDDLLRRRPPRITGHRDGDPLVRGGEETVPRACELVTRLDATTLCIQGPPGTGKTYTAAAMIVELLGSGKRVGVTAQSHQVIMNAIRAVAEAMEGRDLTAQLCKVGDDEDDPLVEQGIVRRIGNEDVPDVLAGGACLVGGTAWLFSREELAGGFDYLFVDEAGQYSLANAVAVGQAAYNLVLVGDQMQLAQVTKGCHPGESGVSCLEYFLAGKPTVPQHLGIFLEASRRMHPDVCRFVSDAVYEGRLVTIPETARHRILTCQPDHPCHPERSEGSSPVITAETGIVWVPVEHDGCEQKSDEECEKIVAIVDELLRRRVVDHDGVERPMTENDVLVVTPFNLQVRCLREKLPSGIRIGSVDKFQGQEAPVVIVSLCSSTLEDSPRGASFLLNPNRLNVAVSRAEALAIVVGCPELMDVRCRSVEEMRLVNLLCHLVQYAEERPQPPSTSVK